MILAAGLTPAWQQILLFDAFTPGEVNRARESHWCASGKVLNVGIAVHYLGAPSQTLSLVGGDSGAAIRREFHERGIPARWIDSATPTRVCTTILDAGSRTTTELVENSAPPAAAERETFLSVYAEEAAKADMVVLSGSLPAGTPSTFYRDLLERTPGRAILDVRGSELLETLGHRPWLVKPNREELAHTLGRDLGGDTETFAAMRELNRRGAEWVVVTQGKQEVLVACEGASYRLVPPPAEVVNPIGCGDCLAAGIAWAVCEGHPPVEAVRLGMAAAADNLAQLLPARLHPDRVRTIAGTVEIVRV